MQTQPIGCKPEFDPARGLLAEIEAIRGLKPVSPEFDEFVGEHFSTVLLELRKVVEAGDGSSRDVAFANLIESWKAYAEACGSVEGLDRLGPHVRGVTKLMKLMLARFKDLGERYEWVDPFEYSTFEFGEDCFDFLGCFRLKQPKRKGPKKKRRS